ncbi:PREDICTED: transmembrane 4 L6 family member 18-like [Nanorana parkeri]|uniref:transmembrane 4 L6 family member 18-like n=1 Tax=Nanorana parkeri TaxID=125878 RepID=UPI0008546168|nr:PREDICTED: transmembrane 4 L6 family member 18-like [Nanorana parkeri]
MDYSSSQTLDTAYKGKTALIPLAVWNIVINILLYFPNGDKTYAANNQLTNYVWYFQGICFGGIMMIIIATTLLLVDFYKCCTPCHSGKKRYYVHFPKLVSMTFAALGVLFSAYTLIISALAIAQGPYCKTINGWEYPFISTPGGYLSDSSTWSQCIEPGNVVEWNLILFSIQIVLSALQVIICFCNAICDLKDAFCGSHRILIQLEIVGGDDEIHLRKLMRVAVKSARDTSPLSIPQLMG